MCLQYWDYWTCFIYPRILNFYIRWRMSPSYSLKNIFLTPETGISVKLDVRRNSLSTLKLKQAHSWSMLRKCNYDVTTRQRKTVYKRCIWCYLISILLVLKTEIRTIILVSKICNIHDSGSLVLDSKTWTLERISSSLPPSVHGDRYYYFCVTWR